MIPINELCKRRLIACFEYSTPIVIPSFSSKGFPNVNSIWTKLRGQLDDVALVSCYDIYYEHIVNQISEPVLLFLDSGGYEARKDRELSEMYGLHYNPSVWTRENHVKAINRLKTYSLLVLVSYDEIDNQVSLRAQIRMAREFFSHFPDAAKCLLVKPFNSWTLDINEFMADVSLFGDFDIIGITEKELGDSFVTRLYNAARLRQILMENGLEIPIHVFGCLDPLSMWLFYLCGADIFDGLTWLRLAFHRGQAIYRNSWAVTNNHINLPDNDLALLMRLENLRSLEAQRLQMIRFARDHDLSRIPIDASQLQRILDSVGVTIGS